MVNFLKKQWKKIPWKSIKEWTYNIITVAIFIFILSVIIAVVTYIKGQ